MENTNRVSPVSVIICAYNAEFFVSGAIRSILNQTYKNFELIIVDDASTDRTSTIIQSLAKIDERVRIVRLDSNGGLAHARMAGFEKANHEYIMYFDADDIALPNMVEKCINSMNSDENIMGVATHAYYIGLDERKIIGVQKIGPVDRNDFFRRYHSEKLMFLPATTVFKRNYFEKVGGFRLNGFSSEKGIRLQDYCDDLDLWCRMSDLGKEGKYFLTITEPLFLYRKNEQSISAQNVFAMQCKMRWIKDCLKRRRAGLTEIPFNDYQKSTSLSMKWNNMRKDYAALIYKQVGFNYLRGQYLWAAPLLATACLLDPHFVVQKLKTQKRKSWQ